MAMPPPAKRVKGDTPDSVIEGKRLEQEDGLSAEELFSKSNGYTYQDYIILPGYISFDAANVTLRSQATKTITLNMPFISSPMDTVTEAQMAIHMALYGGLGIVHCNNTVEEQCDHVRRVKRFENGFILDPFTVSPQTTLEYLDEIKFKCAPPAGLRCYRQLRPPPAAACSPPCCAPVPHPSATGSDPPLSARAQARLLGLPGDRGRQAQVEARGDRDHARSRLHQGPVDARVGGDD